MPLTSDLKYFKLKEFNHPELINERAAIFLNMVREIYGEVLHVTDDARLPQDAPPGASKTSLHYKGQAFDIRTRDKTESQLWRLVSAIMAVANSLEEEERGIELRIVNSKSDKHIHIGFWLNGHHDELTVSAE